MSNISTSCHITISEILDDATLAYRLLEIANRYDIYTQRLEDGRVRVTTLEVDDAYVVFKDIVAGGLCTAEFVHTLTRQPTPREQVASVKQFFQEGMQEIFDTHMSKPPKEPEVILPKGVTTFYWANNKKYGRDMSGRTLCTSFGKPIVFEERSGSTHTVYSLPED